MNLEPFFLGIQEYISSINWASPGWDVFIILFFILASLVYGFSLGRDRIIIILVSIYIALALIHYIPSEWLRGIDIVVRDGFIIQISSFLVLFIILFFFLSRAGLLKALGGSEKFGKLWHIFVFSFLHVGLFIAIFLSFLPTQLTQYLSPTINMIFIHPWALFIWLVLPVIFMMFINREDND